MLKICIHHFFMTDHFFKKASTVLLLQKLWKWVGLLYKMQKKNHSQETTELGLEP